MPNEDFVGIVIMLACCFGCAALFFGIGVWAERRKDPMHFWSGSEIDPRTVSDIPAYNHANAVMWKLYSIPYWAAGVLSLFSLWDDWSIIAGVTVVAAACFPGLPWLIFCYRKIASKYIIR